MISFSEFSSYHDFNEHCDFCVLSFQTRPELKVHVLTHFKKKTCLKTQKMLLLIADDWFELHINQGCTSEQCDSEIISNAVHISEQWVKKEENIEENDLDNDGVLNDGTDGTNSVHMKSESEADINFDAGMSDSSSDASSKKKTRKFESREKKSGVESISASATKENKVKSTTTRKKKSKTLNGKSSTAKIVHPKSKSTKCKICKLKFAQEELMTHLRSRHVPKIDPIPTCETCGKTFSTPGNLRSHQYLHAERGRYICSYCGKEFVRNANLKEHINLHTVNLTNFSFRNFAFA